jgi:hypothetical protein
MNKQQKNVNDLLQLIKENPELPILPIVDGEIVSNDDSNFFVGSWGESRIDYYWYDDDEMIYSKENDFETLVEDIIDTDNNYDENFGLLNNEQKEKEAIKIVEKYNWVKCIFVSINLPNF